MAEGAGSVSDWATHVEREIARYRDGEERLPEAEDADQRQRQLTRIGNAAYGAGLALLMQGRREDAVEWLDRAARRYRESADDAPAGSWGRPIGAMKARIMAGDWEGAEDEARWALELGAASSESPIGKYAAALALLVLGEDEQARMEADELRTRADFAPAAVGDALAMIAAGTDAIGYIEAVEAVLESFETRDDYLEDVPVADTVLVLQALSGRRELAADLTSPLLPAS
jgi:tetratricopeptide (TPR) repeat protein